MKIIRGDSKVWRFQRRLLDGQIIAEVATDVRFTIKKLPECTPVVRKKLGDGIEYNPTDNYYRITLDPKDTQGLDFGVYGFDIEVTTLNVVKTICVGKVTIAVEYTTKGDKQW